MHQATLVFQTHGLAKQDDDDNITNDVMLLLT
jgi:hypothetical protein